MSYGRPWRDDEIELVVINNQTARALAEQLGRSRGSIEMKRKRLSSKPHRRYWTDDEIAMALRDGAVPGRTQEAVDGKLRALNRLEATAVRSRP